MAEQMTIFGRKEQPMPAPVMDSSDLAQAFSQVQNRNEMAEVLKELFDENKIYLIGDLTKDEIKLATRIYVCATMKNIDIWKEGLAFFCKLLISKNRASRREILDAIRGYNAPQGFMSKLNPSNWGHK